jgi:hypothetical protein
MPEELHRGGDEDTRHQRGLTPYVSVSPRKSSASAWSAVEPAHAPALISTRNIHGIDTDDGPEATLVIRIKPLERVSFPQQLALMPAT